MTTPPPTLAAARLRRPAPAVLLAAALSVTSHLLPAQAVAPARPVAPPTDGAVVLNPFVVNTDKDTGYAGSSTLAGTRLNTPIADLGASISIYTKEFLDDIGATSPNDVLIYATGMEAGGPGGNFSGATGNDIAAEQVQSDTSRNEPQAVMRTRGLATPNLTRGHFNTDIASDSYILESITVNRGPNAILAGVGSAAGIVETGVRRASVNGHANRVQFRYGNNDSRRTNVDFNRTLIPGKLGFRIAALDENERYNQRPAFEKKRRIFGAVAFEPFRTTSFRANFEAGGTKANRPFTGLPFKSISDQWLAAGKPLYDWTYFDDPARNPNARAMDPNGTNFPNYQRQGLISPYTGQAQIFGALVQVYNQANARAPSIGYQSTGAAHTTGTAANAIRSNVFDPLFNRDSAFDQYWFIETFNKGEIPALAYPDNFRPAGIKFQGFSDYAAFDWQNRQIDETGRQSDSFGTATFTLEQRAWRDRVGFEASYFRQRYELRNRNAFFSTQGNGNHIRIDPNVTLQNGQPNPNVGRPYTAFGQTADGNSFREREAARVTAFLRYDFRELSPRWGRWIGRHTFSALREQQAADILNFSTRLTNTTGAATVEGAVPPTGFNNRPYLLVYLGDSILNGAPLKLNPIQIPRPEDGFSTQTLVPVVAAGDPAQATYGTNLNVFREILAGANVSREVIKSDAYALQGYWLDDLLVTTLGLRRDQSHLIRPAIPVTATSPLRFGIDQFNLPRTPPKAAFGSKRSLSAVLRWPERLVKLPEGVKASVFANASENFTPSGTRVDWENTTLPSPAGETREVGFNLSFLHNKVSVRYNNFETKIKDGGGSSGVLNTIQNNGINQLHGQIVAAANSSRIDHRPAIQRVLDAVPGFAKAYQVQLTGNALDGTLSYTSVPLSGLADTADSVARGHELELVFNPTRNWRLLANVAQQETVRTNVSPGTRRILQALLPAWNHPDFATINRGSENTLQYLTNLVLVPYANLIATEGVAAAEQRKYRANLVTNYTIRTGKLRGLGFGGGVRWQDKVGIGYVTTRNPDTTVKIDRTRPYFAPGETNVDLFASYGRRLWKDRLDWKVQVNVRNAFGTDTLIAINAQPDGSVAAYRVPPEKRVYLTNTFTF